MMIDKSSTMSNKNIFLDYLKYKPQSLEDCIMGFVCLEVMERKTFKILYIKKYIHSVQEQWFHWQILLHLFTESDSVMLSAKAWSSGQIFRKII